MKKRWLIILGLSGAYLMNPGWGVFEFIPDNIPIIGNIDEGLAALIFLRALIELGVISQENVHRILNLKDNYEDSILGRNKIKTEEKNIG